MECEEQDGFKEKASLIVNYLPQSLRQNELRQLFGTIGPLKSCRLMYDKSTGYSFGYAFVQYLNESDAEKAINQLNGLKIENKTLKVAYSRPKSTETRGSGVCVRNIPVTYDDSKVRSLFSEFGTVVQARVIRDQHTGLSRGIAFVIMSKRSEAQAAIESLDKLTLPGSTSSLSVQFIDNESKRKPIPFKYLQQHVLIKNLNQLIRLPQLIDKLCQYKGNGPTLLQRQIEEHCLGDRDRTQPGSGKRSFDQVAPTRHYRAAEDQNPKSQRRSESAFSRRGSSRLVESCNTEHLPEAMFGRHSNQHSLRSALDCSPGSRNDSVSSFLSALCSDVLGKSAPLQSDPHGIRHTSHGGVDGYAAVAFRQLLSSLDPITGGCIIYVFGIGPEPQEQDIRNLFEQYGQVARVDVIKSLATGRSKGYAFVTMINYDEALAAITALNGTEFGGRKLQVRFKE